MKITLKYYDSNEKYTSTDIFINSRRTGQLTLLTEDIPDLERILVSGASLERNMAQTDDEVTFEGDVYSLPPHEEPKATKEQDIPMSTPTQIEQKLLDRELVLIKEELGHVGIKLSQVFSKYGTITGNHKEKVREFLLSTITTEIPYFEGYKTRPAIRQLTPVPEALKKLILEWATTDFLESVERIKEITDSA